MEDPHASQPLVTAGTELDKAEAAAVLVHGRGADAESIVRLAETFHREGVAYLAPQAEGNEWYPESFLAPVEMNEPGRSSGLRAVGRAVDAARDGGVPVERVVILGFSQGACLASEYAARSPRRYGGVVAFSGGLIGEKVETGDYEGDLRGTPFFVGCSNRDPHIPVERVDVTADVFEALGAEVEKRIYEGMGHTVNRDEKEYVAGLFDRLV